MTECYVPIYVLPHIYISYNLFIVNHDVYGIS
jgi:hypothetical protein